MTVLLIIEHENKAQDFKDRVVDHLQGGNSRRYKNPDFRCENTTVLTVAMSITEEGFEAMEEEQYCASLSEWLKMGGRWR